MRKPRKVPEAPLPADQTVTPSDTNPPVVATPEPTPATKPTIQKTVDGLTIENF